MPNEYRLFNGEVIEINAGIVKALLQNAEKPSDDIIDAIKFDNRERFLRDLADHTNQNAGSDIKVFTVNYGSTVRYINHTDMSAEDYEPFLHKNYPLVVDGSIILDKEKICKFSVNIKKDESAFISASNKNDVLDLGVKKVTVLKGEEVSKRIKIIKEKKHGFDEITPPHVFCTPEEIKILKKAGLMDYHESMYELWGSHAHDNSEEVEKAKHAVVWNDDEYEKRQEELENDESIEYGDPNYKKRLYTDPHQQALTGTVKFYKIEIDCTGLPAGSNSAILFENAFEDEICLGDEIEKGGEWVMDYLIDSSVSMKLLKENFKIKTSFALTDIQADENGKVTLNIINKFIKEMGTDYGWYI